MTPLQRYIAEEIATDHADGLMSRREALRRLGLLGMSAIGASSLLTACGGGDDETAATSSAATAKPSTAGPDSDAPGMDTAVSTEAITWAGPRGELQGAWADAADPQGGVLVIHENKGLNDWTRSVVGRIAGIGYSALAVDLLSEEGGTASFDDPAAATAALGNASPDRLIADVRSGLDEIAQRLREAPLAVVGFCFGGGLTWQLLAAGEPRIAAAVPFYGPAPDNPDFAGSRQAAVLGFYGANDARVNATQATAQQALEQAGMVNELVVEPDADHAFFNDTGQRYDPTAAADAWQRLQDWFAEYLR
ncbi:dienelactone hydrolase family protein [Gordonia sp. HNM0687]|uniref:Dienelactone hydrolase family protein n=1 Tax=Gordonia mangrovi TaxID=2665643 RepID=A0A6L7GR40_9ACTN|nr:dienelactone hydrolase family protein [Gordonia mangrovi]MXP22033.1 dienelactone hydrolase family protein [Gordonia mangrovi]UVF78038.1 dienelactone hydrolase family protein [Gordonia mangrovi]